MAELNSIMPLVGDGAQTNWELNFTGGYLDRGHVFVLIGETTYPAEFLGESTITITPPVPAGQKFYIVRRTPRGLPMVDFEAGARMTEENLDIVAKQALFVAAEALDRGEGAIEAFSPRALMVPEGEVAPPFPSISTLRGKLVAVDQNGKFTGVRFTNEELLISSNLILDDDTPLSAVLDSIRADVADAQAYLADQLDLINQTADDVTDLDQARENLDNRLTQLVSDFETLSGVVDALTELEGDHEALYTVIANETAQRIEGDTAMAATIALIGAKSGTNDAFILDLDTVKVSPEESLAERFSHIQSEAGDALALIQQEASTRAADDAAEVLARTQMGAQIRTDLGADLTAAIQTEQNARVDGDEAEATARQALATTLRNESASNISAAVLAEQNARIAGDNAEASARNTLGATLREETDTKIGAAISIEQAARIAADSAEAEQRTILGAQLRAERDDAIADVSALIQNEQDARVTEDHALASNIDLIAADTDAALAAVRQATHVETSTSEALAITALTSVVAVGKATSAVHREEINRVAQGEAEARVREVLEARVDDAEQGFASLAATVESDRLSRINADEALASEINSLEATMTALGSDVAATQASVTEEATARANADGAIATSLSGLTTRVGANEASISTQATTVNGLQARYSFKLDVNGRVTGMVFGADSSTSYVDWTTDAFRMFVPSLGTSVPVFSATSNGVTFNSNVQINGNLIVSGSITSGNLAQNSVTMPVSAFTASGVTIPSNTWTTVQSVTMTTTGGPVLVAPFFQYEIADGSFELLRIQARVLRDGVEVFSLSSSALRASSGGALPTPVGFSFTDTPGAGAHTYAVQLYTPKNGNPAVNRSLVCVEMRR